MEPPTVKEEMKLEKSFKINSDKNNLFSLNITNLTTSIELSVNLENEIIKHIYKKKYSFEELKKINKYFLLHETIDEIYDDLILLMNKNQTKIYEENRSIKLSIPLESLKIKEIIFILNELEKNDKDRINELYSIISELKEENKKLKEKINEFEIYIPYLKEYKIKQDEKKMNKIRGLDSLIIKNNEKYNISLKNWINPKLNIKADLLYRMTRDGEDYQTFHKLCDNQGPTVVLVKLTDGNILGTYTPLDWETKSNWKSDSDIFVFSLTENKKSICTKKDNWGIYCHQSYGPESHFLAFQPSKTMKEPYLRVQDDYFINASQLVPGKEKGDRYYQADEVEIFKITIG